MTMEAMAQRGGHTTHLSVAEKQTSEPLSDCVRKALRGYFKQLDGHSAANMYQLVLAEVEHPLLEIVMDHTAGNQTHAANILGISRSTLRKKLALYDLD